MNQFLAINVHNMQRGRIEKLLQMAGRQLKFIPPQQQESHLLIVVLLSLSSCVKKRVQETDFSFQRMHASASQTLLQSQFIFSPYEHTHSVVNTLPGDSSLGTKCWSCFSFKHLYCFHLVDLWKCDAETNTVISMHGGWSFHCPLLLAVKTFCVYELTVLVFCIQNKFSILRTFFNPLLFTLLEH